MTSRNRLSRSRDFDAVYRKGRSVSGRYLVLYSFPRPDAAAAEVGESPRLGLAVSRQVGGAAERNRIKRRLREAFASVEETAPGGRDYVLIVRPGLVEAAEARGFEWLTAQVRDVIERAPIVDGARS